MDDVDAASTPCVGMGARGQLIAGGGKMVPGMGGNATNAGVMGRALMMEGGLVTGWMQATAPSTSRAMVLDASLRFREGRP